MKSFIRWTVSSQKVAIPHPPIQMGWKAADSQRSGFKSVDFLVDYAKSKHLKTFNSNETNQQDRTRKFAVSYARNFHPRRDYVWSLLAERKIFLIARIMVWKQKKDCSPPCLQLLWNFIHVLDNKFIWISGFELFVDHCAEGWWTSQQFRSTMAKRGKKLKFPPRRERWSGFRHPSTCSCGGSESLTKDVQWRFQLFNRKPKHQQKPLQSPPTPLILIY